VSFVVKPAQAVQLGATLGYNLTEYDAQVTGGNGLVLKQEGDRIGGPKWTGALFALGESPLTATLTGYLRLDYSFQTSGIPQNPHDFGYDANLTTLPSTKLLSTRIGVRFSSVDISLFANNLTNSTDAIARSHDSTGSALYYAQSYQPRTIGVTALLRY
jgi:hypothetical protein